MKNSAIIPQAG